MVILKVMYENGIDVFVNPEQTTAPYKLGYAGEPEVNDRPQISCCTAFTALGGMPEMDVPGWLHDDQLRLAVRAERRQDRLRRGDRPVESKMPPMPVSMMFWSGPGSDAAVIKAGSAYESATHHRKPPPAFGPVPARPSPRRRPRACDDGVPSDRCGPLRARPRGGHGGGPDAVPHRGIHDRGRAERHQERADHLPGGGAGLSRSRQGLQRHVHGAGDGRWRADPSREGRGARRRAASRFPRRPSPCRRCFPISASTRAGPSSSAAWSRPSPTRACSSSSACASASRTRGSSTRSRRSTSAASARSPARASSTRAVGRPAAARRAGRVRSVPAAAGRARARRGAGHEIRHATPI